MPSMKLRQEVLRAARKIVVKFGTALLTKDGGVLDTARIASLVRQVAELRKRGCEVTIVSSGAIGAGMGLVGMKTRPRDVAKLQALAATGQAALMHVYERAFARYGLHAAQILLTRSDVDNRIRYLNIRNTLANLHELDAVPDHQRERPRGRRGDPLRRERCALRPGRQPRRGRRPGHPDRRRRPACRRRSSSNWSTPSMRTSSPW